MSDLGVLLPFLMFAIVMTGTPGPNNLMVLMSGARVGVLRTMPLVCGIALGIGLQLAIVGSGLGSAFENPGLPYRAECCRSGLYSLARVGNR